MELSPRWEYVSDGVMGGRSSGALQLEGTTARLTGQVSLENNGGFVQMAFDLVAGEQVFDASGWTGLELDVQGNGQDYDLRLRTTQLTRPWQSYRTAFQAPQTLETRQFPFAEMSPHRTEVPFDPARLRRIGILAIGRVFTADVAVAAVRLYR